MNLLLRSILLALGVGGLAREPEHPVCIVGAGPAGLSAAAELELKGYRTVTFEKQNAVGGKCQAVYEKHVLFSYLETMILANCPTHTQFHIQSSWSIDLHSANIPGINQTSPQNWSDLGSFRIWGKVAV